MGLIDRIAGPEDLKALPGPRLPELAEEIRAFLVENVSKTGGHLGPNLGVVELTIALHRVFDSPSDAILFDTGHQSYVHKILTGRHDFSALRREGGLSGYPSRAESAHDVVENSHATTALSWADGIARGFQLSGQTGRRAVAVVGDGAMTGGMAWEALNNIAEDSDRPLVVVINDNDRSYAPTVGGLVRKFDPVRRLDSIRLSKSYEAFLDWTKRTLRDAGPPGRMAYGALHSIKKGVKDIFVDAGIFDSLGLKYIGPIDGHNLDDLIEALTLARDYGGPVVVHAITEKGRGYEPAERDVHDRFHAIGAIHPETGLPIAPERPVTTEEGAALLDRIDDLRARMEKAQTAEQATEKDLAAMQVWGEFSYADLRRLRDAGYEVTFFSCPAARYDEAWETDFYAVPIATAQSATYFITITPIGTPIDIDAERVRMPEKDLDALRNTREEQHRQREELNAELLAVALNDYRTLEAYDRLLENEYTWDNAKVQTEREADDRLMLLEGWIPAAEAQSLESAPDRGAHRSHIAK